MSWQLHTCAHSTYVPGSIFNPARAWVRGQKVCCLLDVHVEMCTPFILLLHQAEGERELKQAYLCVWLRNQAAVQLFNDAQPMKVYSLFWTVGFCPECTEQQADYKCSRGTEKNFIDLQCYCETIQPSLQQVILERFVYYVQKSVSLFIFAIVSLLYTNSCHFHWLQYVNISSG